MFSKSNSLFANEPNRGQCVKVAIGFIYVCDFTVKYTLIVLGIHTRRGWRTSTNLHTTLAVSDDNDDDDRWVNAHFAASSMDLCLNWIYTYGNGARVFVVSALWEFSQHLQADINLFTKTNGIHTNIKPQVSIAADPFYPLLNEFNFCFQGRNKYRIDIVRESLVWLLYVFFLYIYIYDVDDDYIYECGGLYVMVVHGCVCVRFTCGWGWHFNLKTIYK